MSMNIPSYQSRQKRTGLLNPGGAVLGLVGMTAYHLPITKDRFVKRAFDLTAQAAEDKIEILNRAAREASVNKFQTSTKMFLNELGVAEDVSAIGNKISEIRKSITDPDEVKALKQSFADNFKVFKKSEAAMDAISSKAFSKIRWTNFGWGAFIGYVLGTVLSSARPSVPSVNSNIYQQ